MKLSREFLDQLTLAHGPSYYLLDSVRFRENFTKLTAAFREYYPATTIAYSYKTNYVPRFCEIVEQLGGYAEVVSSMEMMLALKLGISSKRIYFNGPYKELIHVENLLRAGGTVNIDSLDELESLSEVAHRNKGESFKIGLRCNFDVFDGVVSRFGFDVNSNEFIEATKLIYQHPGLELVGLHCHFAARNLDCWRNRTQGMLAVIDRFFRHRLQTLRYISLGGGMYGHMPEDLKSQFNTIIPEFKDYALVAAKPFAEYLDAQSLGIRPTLIIEPGTALVADAMKYVCTVDSIKNIRGRDIVSLAGSSYNINPNSNRKNVPIEIIEKPNVAKRTFVNDAYFGGYTCIEGDYLFTGFSGSLAIGDYVVFDDVGSYSVVMKPPFILPNVSILEPIGSEMAYRVIKRREQFEDVFSTYTFQ